MPKHTKSLQTSIYQDEKCPILEYFHEIQLDEDKYAKTLYKYVCFHYNYHFLRKIYLINAEIHQITWNKWYSKLGNAPSGNISVTSTKIYPNMLST